MLELLRVSVRRLILLAVLFAFPAAAVPTSVTFQDTSDCDVLSVPALVEELGNPAAPPFGPSGPFPADEAIASGGNGSANTTCAEFAFGPVVQITNLTTTSFDNVWYVADPEAYFENFDGLVNGGYAVKIDAVGVNTPLVAESIAFDGIFAPGETWSFGLASFDEVCGFSFTLFGSIGVATSPPNPCDGPSPPDGSTGSIIATAVPEPSTLGLVGLGMLGFGAVRRRG